MTSAATNNPAAGNLAATLPAARSIPAATMPSCGWWLGLPALDRRLTGRWLAWAGSSDGAAVLGRWAEQHRALAGWAKDQLIDTRYSPATDAMQATLLGLAQNGSAEAGLTLLVQLRPGLVRLARTATRWDWIMETDVHEEVQATFFEVLYAMDRSRRRHRIAANLLLDTRQRLWRRFPRAGPPVVDGLDPVDVDPRTAAGPSTPIDVLELRLRLRDGVRRLPGSEDSRRLTATMAYRAWFEEQPTAAIATDLGVAPQTVATRLYRLRRILKADW